ncbi:MAG: arginine deiminase family protein [Saprospiraceae bacterium]
MKNVHVSSEIGKLKRVIVHRPDEGIARISPKRAADLLFDDIIHLPQMQTEHDIFTEILRRFIGSENVLETRDLLIEAVRADETSKAEIIEKIVDYEELPAYFKQTLLNLSNEELADCLITGYLAKTDDILFDPIPNFIFTRDIAVTVNDHVIITKAAKTARFRENFLTRFIIWAHPIFKNLWEEGRIINLNRVELFPPSKKGELVAIEGGDVMIINQDYLLIGCSERTNEYSIRCLKDVLLEKGVVKNVVQVDIPHDRSYMHLDTIFTVISDRHCVAYSPIVVEGLSSWIEVYRQDGTKTDYATIKEFITTEINPNMEFILSGNGESPYQEREQWTDGCNLVALKSGVAITYDRNPMTEIAFKNAGYRVIHAEDLLEAFNNGVTTPQEVENTIITLSSGELSRARGGSHCMTCPIERLDFTV